MDTFNMDSLMESLATGTPVDINSFQYNPLNEFSFLANGNEYEITTGIHKSNPVIKVRYGSSRSPQVLFNSNNRYFLNTYHGMDEDNHPQFREINGTIIPRTAALQPFVPKQRQRVDQPMGEASLRPAGKIAKTPRAPRAPSTRRAPMETGASAALPPVRNRYQRARAREVLSLPPPDELADLFSRTTVTSPQSNLPNLMQEFGKRRVKRRVKSANIRLNTVNADIRFLKKR